ncbi:GNAT family N-acetyltransferase [Caulobacter sp. KR2-114]|uniref:GNAT family N-acetyltransferase n=1 Tax=Caulobacter sp. KR2-114 TaxID=3400912 RepID=UPI003C0BC0C0
MTLRPLSEADSAPLHTLMSDPDVMAHWDIGAIEDPDLTDAIVASQISAMNDGHAQHWAITLTATGGFLGVCDLSDIDRWHHRGEIGFLLGRDAWGQGYALEAMRAVVTQAAALGLRRLTARTHVGNLRSEQLLAKLGFEMEGYLRGHIQRDGERRDCRLFGLLL